MGVCGCTHAIGARKAQLLPCRFAAHMFVDGILENDSDWELFEGITDGFGIVDSDVTAYDCSNYNSILEQEAKLVMNNSVATDLAEGRIAVADSTPTCIHALGAVPKASGGYRTITDCSRPDGLSVNDHMDSLAKKFEFKQMEYATSMITNGSYLFVVDIQVAYRAVCIDPDHWRIQGFRWGDDDEETLYIDQRMCFGARTAPYYFSLVSDFIQRTLTKEGNLKLMNYTDDFLVVADTEEGCLAGQYTVTSFLRYLGFYVAWSKVTAPSTEAQYLGIIVDTLKMELRMPEGKLDKMNSLLGTYSNKSWISKKDLERLTGLLGHCAQCVRGGRIFCRRLYSLYKQMVQKNLGGIQIPSMTRDDIRWWSKFGRTFNGAAIINNTLSDYPVHTDASKEGFACVMGSDWVAGTWTTPLTISVGTNCTHTAAPPTLDVYNRDNINKLELWAVVVALHRWHVSLANHTLILFTDNMQVLYALTNGKSANSTCMCWVREVYWLAVIYNIDVQPVYIRSEDNIQADTLSPLQENQESGCRPSDRVWPML